MLEVKIETYNDHIPYLEVGQVRSCSNSKGFVLIVKGKGTNKENGHDFVVIALNDHVRAKEFEMRYGLWADEDCIKKAYPKLHKGELTIIRQEETNND